MKAKKKFTVHKSLNAIERNMKTETKKKSLKQNANRIYF